MKNNSKTTDHHGFCENPESKCTLNYCDENGCTERKRYLVDLVTPTTMSDKEEAEMIERESTIKRLESMIDRAVVQLDEYQDFYESDHGEPPEGVAELKNEFCAFREYWIHKLKHKQP